MSDLLGVALINAGAALLLLLLGARLNRKVKDAAKDSAATLWQVRNGHKTNLREEADSRHEENRETQAEILDEVRGLKDSVRRLWRVSDEQGDAIDTLTHPKQKRENT